MAYTKLNSRSIRLFVATPEELERNRPNLNAPYFRISKEAITSLYELSRKTGSGDVVCGLSVWKRQGADGKPDFFSAEVSFPDDITTQNKYLDKDDAWLKEHPKTERNAERKAAYRKRADKDPAEVDLSEEQDHDLPF